MGERPRIRYVVTIGAVVAALVIAAAVVLRPSDGRPAGDLPVGSSATSPPRAAPTLPSCVTTGVSVEDVSDVLFLPSIDTAGPLVGPAEPRSDIPPWSQRTYVAYAMAGGEVTRRLMVESSENREQSYTWYDPANDPDGHPAKRWTATVGGISRDFVMQDSAEPGGRPWLVANWHTPGDTHYWAARSDGISLQQLQAVLTSLDTAGGRVSTRDVPPGFSEWAPVVTTSTAGGPIRSLRVQFHMNRALANAAWDFFVNDGGRGEEAPLHGQRVGVRGQPGWWVPAVRSTEGGTLIWRQGRLTFEYRFWGDPDVSRDQAVAVGESVARVSPADPRFTASCRP